MGRNVLVLLLALVFSAQAEKQEGCEHSATEFRCVEYLKNYDGDTITFKIPNVHPLIGNKISVRVLGVDTAELRSKDKCEKAAGRTAKKLVESMLSKAKRIDLKNVERGKYFRIVADVIVDGKSLKEMLLAENLAYAYEGGTKPTVAWCNLGERLPAVQ